MANQDTLNRMADVARLQYFKAKEQAFVASFATSVTSGGTINMQLSNPSDSDVTLDVSQFLFSSQFKGQFKIYDQFDTAPSGGSVVGIDNLLMDSGGNGGDVGTATANSGVTFTTNGTPHFSSVLPGGGVGGTGTGGAAVGTEPIIEPGREVVLELQNDGTDAAPGSIGVVYLEREDL